MFAAPLALHAVSHSAITEILLRCKQKPQIRAKKHAAKKFRRSRGEMLSSVEWASALRRSAREVLIVQIGLYGLPDRVGFVSNDEL
jgi:hypothetical protein